MRGDDLPIFIFLRENIYHGVNFLSERFERLQIVIILTWIFKKIHCEGEPYRIDGWGDSLLHTFRQTAMKTVDILLYDNVYK